MTIPEFAEYCRVSVRMVKRWIRQADLTAANGLRNLPGGQRRIDLIAWERQLRDILVPALIAVRTLHCHALLSVVMRVGYHGILRKHLV